MQIVTPGRIIAVALSVVFGGYIWSEVSEERELKAAAHAKQEAYNRAQSAEYDAQLAKITSLPDTDAPTSGLIIEIANSGDVGMAAVRKRWPDFSLRDQVVRHATMGYQALYKINSTLYDKYAEIDCINRIKAVTSTSGYTRANVYREWELAKGDLQIYIPVARDPKKAVEDCKHRFQVVYDRIEDTSKKPKSFKELGEAVGRATNQVGTWWDQTTEPVSKAITDFQEGFESTK